MRGARVSYDGLFRNSPLAAFVFDRDGIVLSWNPAATETFGWTEPEVLGRVLPIVPSHAMDEFDRLRAHVLAGNVLNGLDTLRQRKDGTVIAVRVSAAPYRDENGRTVGVLAMLQDLSATRSLERNVAETNRLLSALVAASPVAIIVADAEGRIRIWNEAAEKMYGWKADQIVGEQIDVIGSTAAGTLLMQLAANPHRRQFPATTVTEKRRDGTEFIASPAAVVVAESDRAVAMMATVRDVTTEVEAQRAAVRASAELRALTLRTMGILEEERMRISREIHDDLGQLLTGVTLELAALRNRERLEEGTSTRLDRIVGTLDRAKESLRRITSDLRPPLLDAFGLVAAVQTEIARFQESTGIECDLSVPDGELAVRDQVATAIYRIVQEALTNIARHAEAQRVDVRIRRRDGTLYVELRDDGRGIDPARVREGALGLVGMRERAASVGGELRIDAGEPAGTVVTLVVPLDGEAG